MLADILMKSGQRVAHNRSGSNLVRGVASALTNQSDFAGRPRADVGVIESDEAALQEILSQIDPSVVLLNNLFRDQLDRYGELDTIASLWRPALKRLPAESTVVVNVDDPTLAALTEGICARRVTFGLDDRNPLYLLDEIPHAADAKSCRTCSGELVYERLYSAHLALGAVRVAAQRAPNSTSRASTLRSQGVESLRLQVARRSSPESPLALTLTIPGLYNAYNATAAATIASTLAVPDETIAAALAAYRSAFGRIERVTYRGHTLTLALVKNPVGFNETLRMLTVATGGLTAPTLIAINDLTADGRDVSWLWDVDFEMLDDGPAPLYTTGIRGADMANRLHYAGIPATRVNPLAADLATGLDVFVAALPEGIGGLRIDDLHGNARPASGPG